jgi:hypothetical protein
MPTITALAVPQATSRPVWLSRQTIFIGLAGGRGAGATTGAAATGAAAFGAGEQAHSAARHGMSIDRSRR